MSLTALQQSLLLTRVPRIGLKTYWQLLEAFGSLENIFALPSSQLGLRSDLVREFDRLRDPSHHVHEEISKTIDWCNENHIQLICHENAEYPQQLLEIAQAPPVIFVKGDLAVLEQPQVAIVGSRSSSLGGKTNAFNIAAELSKAGIAITSGLALGIDGHAHQGALQGKGKTVAVVATGIDQVYPRRHAKLAEQVLAHGGAIVSEFPLFTAPTPQNFPQRNRIISGLSLGTLVVEAALKSGSLITAKFALEQNREVFAMPGSIHNPLSKGCHWLIKQGATLVENAADIASALSYDVSVSAETPAQESQKLNIEPKDAEVLKFVEHDPQSLDTLAERSGISIDQLLASLMTLELGGVISNEAGLYARLT